MLYPVQNNVRNKLDLQASGTSNVTPMAWGGQRLLRA